ncbi:MAG: outer membrane beta-barrel protein [Thermoanaerobaculia bacterium]|nr:outer membrane beta-barrel protein [Thermoanaerobaculia bacterium]
MRPLPLLSALVLIAAGAATARPASAQSYSDPGLGLGAHAGLAEGRSSDAPSFTGSLHVRYRLTGSLGLEGGVGFRSETVDDGGGPLLDVVDLPVTGTGQLFFFPRTRVQPFLLAGAGLHVVKTTPKGRNTTIGGSTKAVFAMHAGAGLDVRPSRRTALHLEGRWVFLDLADLDDLAAASYPVRQGYVSITLGVTFFR